MSFRVGRDLIDLDISVWPPSWCWCHQHSLSLSPSLSLSISLSVSLSISLYLSLPIILAPSWCWCHRHSAPTPPSGPGPTIGPIIPRRAPRHPISIWGCGPWHPTGVWGPDPWHTTGAWGRGPCHPTGVCGRSPWHPTGALGCARWHLTPKGPPPCEGQVAASIGHVAIGVAIDDPKNPWKILESRQHCDTSPERHISTLPFILCNKYI